jgi:hypothetical protein
LNAQRCNGRRALEAVYGDKTNGVGLRAVCRGVGRSGASIKRWMGDDDGFAGMAGVGYRKL